MLKNPTLRLTFFYAASLAFILLNLWFVVKKDSLLINVLPFVFALVLLAIYSVDRLLYLVVFFTPLSVPLSQLRPGLPFDMNLPTEPLLFGVLLLFLLKLFSERDFNGKILRHPVSWAIWIYLFWLFLTSFTSTMPVVSFKFLLVKIWFVTAFYLLAIKLFEEQKNIPTFIWIYIASFLIVIGYTIFRHTGYGLWNKQAAHFVMTPFFNDHTSYGAMLAMFIPFMTFFSFNRFGTARQKWLARTVLMILLTAFVLSYTRAAWLSLFAAIGVWALLKLKIRFQTLLITFLSLTAFILVFQKQIVLYLERNDDESSSNLIEHFSSMSNITSDASNLERLNRWSCAVRMFQDKPVFGYGAGTYMFQYAPYQLNRDRTIISTNAGDGGNAHSEYLGPLAETGLLGMLSVLFLFGTVIFTAIRTYSRLNDPRLKSLVAGALLGLVTYYVHGVMNNFLDTDKASVPFWGFTAVIVVLDLYSRKTAAAVAQQ